MKIAGLSFSQRLHATVPNLNLIASFIYQVLKVEAPSSDLPELIRKVEVELYPKIGEVEISVADIETHEIYEEDEFNLLTACVLHVDYKSPEYYLEYKVH